MASIGSYAFYKCSSLPQVVIPEGVKTIGNNSFQYCNTLESVTIPSTVENISRNTFDGCAKLKNVIIAKGDTHAKISSYAFQNFTSLTSIAIPGNYVSIDNYVFSGCTSLEKFSWEKGMYGYNNQSISAYAFGYNNSISIASLPSTLGTIEKNAFYNVKSTFVIEGEAGSEAESYAKTNGITFKSYSQPLSINAVISRQMHQAVLQIISISLLFIMKIQANGALLEITVRQADLHGYLHLVQEDSMLRLRTVQERKY